ncbi:roquin-1b isoform X1 [Hippoglossus hippoglossus]|uniref:roquin-1b isoform X1 n=1 Tax=Hippoglossus hippoglossus TaxID=8267 RepID=UPI00148C2AE8|nr:roquin-1b isoform X1 [Hippoglossus hippoglossus]XP_034468939.1 roquin-1b isoform X1 [Hippoglossus hippoglossus]XP_035025774.1 roquin-1 isoform X1 [Hippoglossus stenolepis]
MPVQAPQWTEFLLCPICTQTFEETVRRPISLGCGHTVCKMCLNKLHRKACPFDQTAISTDIEQLPVNTALLQLVGGQVPKAQPVALITSPEDSQHYEEARQCVEELALYLKPLSNTRGVGLSSTAQSILSRPMQRKLVTLVHCQLVEEEGRVRAMRAARSLGERTVTELILQHQNPQQLSSNLWAAVRARGCQFLGPAMQEEALKLVLLALEDGSALSRKVLVLFVVQRLEPRFPQASKTSIGHVVQLLYRASCFKVTKRDEDSSLMQLKEEFRTYEALRREHDSQIVQIAMEGGLRIAPDQWSSLLYGDQSHKSHMQSIIDKLQTPGSFAQSVQELTIALQRTGDPANLNRLRPHLELLANIDPSPDAPPPTWEQLDKGLVAVKTVVHGLVDFIQNHSKKGADPQQPPQHSKYKTYMCRDMKQKGGCPRGASCTFAHSQEELEKYRKMNKRLATRLPGPGGLMPDDGLPLDVAVTRKPSPLPNGSVAPSLPQLIARSTDAVPYELLRKPIKMDGGIPSAPGSPPDIMDPGPKPCMPLPPHVMSHSRMPADHLSGVKHMPVVPRSSPVYSQQQVPEMCYDSRPPPSASQYDPPQYPTGYPYQQPPQYVPRDYIRNPPPPSESGPPYQDPYPGYGPPERPYQAPHSGQNFSYPHPPQYDRGRHGHYPGPPPPPQPYPSQRDNLIRMSPAPHDVPPPSAGQAGSLYHQEPTARDRYPPDGYYPPGAQAPPMRAYVRGPSYSGQQPSLDYLHRRRQELLSQLEERKVISPPPFAASPALSHPFPSDYPPEYGEENSKTIGKCREPDYAGQYSPWSCETIGSYIGTKDAKPKDVMVSGTMEIMNVEAKGLRDPSLEAPRRGAEVKDDDPIIPFGPQPTVSRFGAISRTTKTGYQTVGPVQAMASTPQNPNSKHMTMPAEYSYGSHGGWGGASYPSHQTGSSSQGHFSERMPMAATDREQLKIELQQVNQQINQQTQMHSMEAANNSLLLQREASALAGQSVQPCQSQSAAAAQQQQAKWPAGGAAGSAISSEQLSMELHQVEREIGKRTREMAMENQVAHDVQQYKMKPTENGQPEHKTLEEISLALGEVSNGSSSLQESAVGGSMLSLTNKTSGLSLCSDPGSTGSEMQKNGVVHSCS